ncbi:MAG: tetratricopeptide (TPR) repeat protein [Cyclobacteriaceae bacterium]|jgi:tetratricopeptide (TPR) repeat protein
MTESIDMLYRAYTLDMARKDTSALGYDPSLVVNLEERMGNLDKALEYSKESLAWLRPIGSNANSKGMRLIRIGQVFLSRNELDSAKNYIQQAKKEFEKIGDSTRLTVVWNTLAKLSIQKGEYASAIQLAKKSKAWNGRNKVSAHTSKTNLMLIEAYQKNGQLEKALEVIEENLIISKKLGLLNDLKKPSS